MESRDLRSWIEAVDKLGELKRLEAPIGMSRSAPLPNSVTSR